MRSIGGIRRIGPRGARVQRLWLVRPDDGTALPLSCNVRIGSAADGAQFEVAGARGTLVDVVVGFDGPVAVPMQSDVLVLNRRRVTGSAKLARGDQLNVGGTAFEVSDRAPR